MVSANRVAAINPPIDDTDPIRKFGYCIDPGAARTGKNTAEFSPKGKPIRNFSIDPKSSIRTPIADAIFADAISETPKKNSRRLELSISKNTPHGRWGQGPGSVDRRFPAGLPFPPVPEILAFVAFRDSGKLSSNFPGTFLENPRTDPGNSHSLLEFSEISLRAQRLKKINLDWNFQSRLKKSILIEIFNPGPSEFPTKNRGLAGGGIENFNLDWNFQSRRAILNFFNLWALRVCQFPKWPGKWPGK